MGFKFMEFPNDVISVAGTITLCFTELELWIMILRPMLNMKVQCPIHSKTVLHDKCKLSWDGEVRDGAREGVGHEAQHVQLGKAVPGARR